MKKGEQFQIDPKSELYELPEQKTPTPSSEFRIIEDHESDDEQYWKELDFNGKQLRPVPGDLILLKKR